MIQYPRLNRIAGAILFVGGVILIGVGFYFMLLRPPFLPEDLRYLGTHLSEVDSRIPKLRTWLDHVFRVIGGYLVASGVLTSYVSMTSFRQGKISAGIAIAASGFFSIGLMSVVNFQINSDFKWPLFSLAMLWVIALGCFLVSRVPALK